MPVPAAPAGRMAACKPGIAMDQNDAVVMLVDDDADVREAVGRLLRAAGWTTRVFASAQDFMAAQPVERGACLVLDVSMPGMSGPELHAWMKERGMPLPVIYLSAHVDVPTSVLAMKRGALDVLEKPFDGHTLLRLIGEAVEQHRLERARHSAHDEIGRRLKSLSAREREVLEHVILGRLNKQTAFDLGIVEKTVKVHRSRMMAKLGMRSVAELVGLCHQIGLTRKS